MKQTFEDAVLKTVLWWSEKAFQTSMNQNNGDDSLGGGMTFLLMNMVSQKAKENITKDNIFIFERELSRLITENKTEFGITLDVDYHPCDILSEACKLAQIDPSCLPCKSCTRIDKDNNAYAKYQYGGTFKQL
jgi:hypothetical protein